MRPHWLNSLRGITRRLSMSSQTSVGTLNHATRVRWIEAKLRALPRGIRLLDAGAGEMQFRSFCTHLKYVSQDFDKYDGQGDGCGLQQGHWDRGRVDIVCDITRIPEPDASFDAILCTEVLEHLPEPVQALKEFQRLLRSTGDLIITAPFTSLTHFAPYHFHTGFNSYFYEHHLRQLGFEILEITENGNYFEFIAQELRRIPDVASNYTSSRLGWRAHRHINGILKLLERLSREDRGSKRLLNFDLQVHARKRGFPVAETNTHR
jgi:SAM-dependent methyltransferase